MRQHQCQASSHSGHSYSQWTNSKDHPVVPAHLSIMRNGPSKAEYYSRAPQARLRCLGNTELEFVFTKNSATVQALLMGRQPNQRVPFLQTSCAIS